MSFFIITSAVFFLNCEKKTETVFITPNISVALPANYEKIISNSKSSVITNPELIVENKIYGYMATIKNDDIFISDLSTNEFDTLSLEQKKEKLNPNIKGFMRGFSGNKLTHKDTIIHGLVQSDFSFEFKKKDRLFIVYGKLIIQENNLLFLNYSSKIPITNKSIKEKDHFFKSIQFK